MLQSIKNYLINSYGIKTDKKIVIFLVDDYGTIRISSGDALKKLKKLNPQVSENRFNRLDALASSKDLSCLFEVLTSVKDKNNQSAVFTPMTVVANPDFRAIEEDGFQKYYYNSFFDTLEQFDDAKEIKQFWKEGINSGIFMPEFHGREHLNVKYWMQHLQNEDPHVLEAFHLNSIGIDAVNDSGYMAAFDWSDKEHILELEGIITEGLKVFETMFGYKSMFFTASALIHNDAIHKSLHENGIKFIDMARSRQEPKIGGGYKRRIHYMGQKNRLGQQYLTRNVMFEPNMNSKDWVGRAMKEISVAFQYKKPAIISSHRVNFVGGKSEENRNKGLKDLKDLLSQIVKQWPEVEFMAVRELTKLFH